MKYFAVIALALVAIYAVCAEAQSHNIAWGSAGPKDKLAHREIVTKKSKLLQIVESDFVYPSKGASNVRNITAIKVVDQYVNGKGGYATLKSGGVGYRDVTVHMKSQRGHGFNFIVEVYTN